jgi:hypothetical protein
MLKEKIVVYGAPGYQDGPRVRRLLRDSKWPVVA